MSERKNNYYKEYIQDLNDGDILPGIIEFCTYLKQKGLKIAIGSSSKNTPAILKRVGLDNYFDAVVDGNDIQKSKPNPEVFLLAANVLGITPNDCLVVEDADAGVEAAITGNMDVLAVGAAASNPKATYSAKNLIDLDYCTLGIC